MSKFARLLLRLGTVGVAALFLVGMVTGPASAGVAKTPDLPHIVTPTAHSSLSGPGTARTYTLTANCDTPGPDAALDSGTDTVTVTVNPATDAPSFTQGAYQSVEEDPWAADGDCDGFDQTPRCVMSFFRWGPTWPPIDCTLRHTLHLNLD